MHCSPEAQSVTEIGPPSTLLPSVVTPLSRTPSLPLRNLSITAPGFQFSCVGYWLLVRCAPAIIPSLLCRDARFQPCCQRCNHHATSMSRPRPSHSNTTGSTFSRMRLAQDVLTRCHTLGFFSPSSGADIANHDLQAMLLPASTIWGTVYVHEAPCELGITAEIDEASFEVFVRWCRWSRLTGGGDHHDFFHPPLFGFKIKMAPPAGVHEAGSGRICCKANDDGLSADHSQRGH